MKDQISVSNPNGLNNPSTFQLEKSALFDYAKGDVVDGDSS
jgi:hypothetical protein